MIFDSIQIEHCHQCKSKDVVTYYLLEWNNFDPELVGCCSDQNCMYYTHRLKAKTTDLTLEEAQLLLIKSRL